MEKTCLITHNPTPYLFFAILSLYSSFTATIFAYFFKYSKNLEQDAPIFFITALSTTIKTNELN